MNDIVYPETPMEDGGFEWIYINGEMKWGVVRIGERYHICHMLDTFQHDEYYYDSEHAARHELAEVAGEQGWRKID